MNLNWEKKLHTGDVVWGFMSSLIVIKTMKAEEIIKESCGVRSEVYPTEHINVIL
jgi:hypothetical protein